jgi:nitroimidazol reductase NimA-like FMN-containing flavoprotein (pyridoxamine 5'-phosphate oxidase superfamily)
MGIFSRKESESLRKQQVGRLATVSRDQFPHVTPVAYATDGERLYLNIEYNSKKTRNIRENPRISFVVDDFTSWEECGGCAKSIRGVMMSGKAELISKGKIHQIGRDLIYKKYPKYQETYPIKEGGWSRYILVITPTNVKSRGLQPN